MSDEPTYAERLARIAELEERLAGARSRAANDARERNDLARRVKALRKEVRGLERRAARKRGDASTVVKNPVAAALAALGLVAAIVGVAAEARLFARPVRWVETTCTVRTTEEDGLVARSPEGVSFPAPSGAVAGARVRCFVPDVSFAASLGRTEPPSSALVAPRDKLRKPFLLLVVEGLAALALLAWIAIRSPAEDA